MPLKLNIKPGEKIFVGGAVLQNGGGATISLIVLNNAAILREKEILKEEDAHTLGDKIYLTVQLIYIDVANRDRYPAVLKQLMLDLLTERPDTASVLADINTELAYGEHYAALRHARALRTTTA